MPTLADLRPGQAAVVDAVDGPPALVQRLAELGLWPGETVRFVGTAPLGDPLELVVGNTRLSVRRADAGGVRVAAPADAPGG